MNKYLLIFGIPILIVVASLAFPDREKVDLKNLSKFMGRAVCEEGVLSKVAKMKEEKGLDTNAPAELLPLTPEAVKEFQNLSGTVMDSGGWTPFRTKYIVEHSKPDFKEKIITKSVEVSQRDCPTTGSVELRTEGLRYLLAAYCQ
jgi:hypothetical protein